MSENLDAKLNESTTRLAKFLQDKCKKQNLTITTAESCTGGLASASITDIPGSSSVFEQGFVTYSNQAKINMLGVNAKTLKRNGAVSEVIALEMLLGALEKSKANIGVAITGIAGPGGATDEKPVGTVCFAWGNKNSAQSSTEFFTGERSYIRHTAVNNAFQKLIELAK